jgi:hypothetical protein
MNTGEALCLNRLKLKKKRKIAHHSGKNLTKGKPAMRAMPTSVTQEEFNEHMVAYLSTAQRGYVSKIPLYKNLQLRAVSAA